MVIQKVNIDQLISNGFDYKEKCYHKKELVTKGLKLYGQLYPILVYKIDEEHWMVIKGHKVIECMKDLNMNEVYIHDIGLKNDVEMIGIKNILDTSTRDIDILKYALILEEVRKNHNDQEIANMLHMSLQQVLVLRDLLKLEFNVNIKKDKSQGSLFGEELN